VSRPTQGGPLLGKQSTLHIQSPKIVSLYGKFSSQLASTTDNLLESHSIPFARTNYTSYNLRYSSFVAHRILSRRFASVSRPALRPRQTFSTSRPSRGQILQYNVPLTARALPDHPLLQIVVFIPEWDRIRQLSLVRLRGSLFPDYSLIWMGYLTFFDYACNYRHLF
jgi:hypothetical protein